MTKLERLTTQLEKLRVLRSQSLQRNDFVNMYKCSEKIKEVEAEIKAAKEYEPRLLSTALEKQGNDVKNRIYKAMLKCSLAADFLNDCSFEARSEIKAVGLNDFHFRVDLDNLVALSQKIASMVMLPNQNALADMMTDDDEFINACHEAANKRLKETINL
jgi:hypothetical protein